MWNIPNLCNEYEKKESNNKHLINNFKGVINFLQGNLDIAENNFLSSHLLNSNFEDPIKNLYLIYLKKNNPKKLLEFAKKLYEINNESDLYTYQLAYAHELNYNNKLALELLNWVPKRNIDDICLDSFKWSKYSL